MIPIFPCLVNKRNEIELIAPQRFEDYKQGLQGQHLELILRKQRSTRSLPQNSYYWAVVIELLSQHTGYEQDEMHEVLKMKFLKYVDDKGNERTKSTSKLNTSEFEDYLTTVKRWAIKEMNCYIPDPNEILGYNPFDLNLRQGQAGTRK